VRCGSADLAVGDDDGAAGDGESLGAASGCRGLGVDGPACAQWRKFIQLGLPRYLLVTTLKQADPSPTEDAAAAPALTNPIWILRPNDAEIPGMQWELLPALMAAWLLELV
jgi:hypothetical protein